MTPASVSMRITDTAGGSVGGPQPSEGLAGGLAFGGAGLRGGGASYRGSRVAAPLSNDNHAGPRDFSARLIATSIRCTNLDRILVHVGAEIARNMGVETSKDVS